jgi:hypothetical protein
MGPNGLPLSHHSNKHHEYHRHIFRKRDLGGNVIKPFFQLLMLWQIGESISPWQVFLAKCNIYKKGT